LSRRSNCAAARLSAGLGLASILVAVTPQASLSLKETRIDTLRRSIFTPPIDPDSPGLAPLRAQGAYSWLVMPAIAQDWQTKKAELGLLVRVLGPPTPPSGLVLVVDGTTTLISEQGWQKGNSGGWVLAFGRQELVRSIASAKQVTITVLGSPPLEGRFQAGDLNVFPAVVGIFDHNSFQAGAPATSSPSATASPISGILETPNSKTSKNSDYLQTRVGEAATMCHDNIVSSAKDPAALVMADTYGYRFGSVLTKNWIFIDWEIMGRNTFGAVLKHSIGCIVECAPGKACKWMSMADNPY
jgi:hypothetical protein